MTEILKKGGRNGFESLIFGSEANAGKFLPGSVDLTNMGVSTLRQDDFYLIMDYGPHGGFHGHYDKGAITLYKNSTLVKDYGSASYGLPLHEQYLKRTLSHSTVLVDGNSQLETEGTLK